MKRIGVFTSGGDAPGMNACIRAVVRTAVASGLEVYGIQRGYQGMVDGEMQKLDTAAVANIIQNGGTILKSSRSEEFRTTEGRLKAFQQLQKFEIEGLVCIGGNGTYTGALKLQAEHGIPSIGCPGTIDNDLYGTDFTIGFDTAINTATQAIDKIRDTADAHNRIFFVEVMGRHSGYIALYAGIACGAEGILIPERHNEMQDIIKRYAAKDRDKAFSIFLIAEGDEEGRAFDIARDFQTQFPNTDTRVTILGHVQRGGNPSAADRVLASRLGAHAVQGLLQGKSNCAAGVINNEVVFTDFDMAIHCKKDIPMNLWDLNQIICS